MVEEVISEIQEEMLLIEQLFSSYGELLERVQERTPDLVEMTAVASVLHSFYNAVENIFLRIAKGIDSEFPGAEHWHRELLMQMTRSGANREAVLPQESAQRLGEYLSFRHFYRHSYAIFLEWAELVKLVEPLQEVWEQTKHDLQLFIEGLSTARSADGE